MDLKTLDKVAATGSKNEKVRLLSTVDDETVRFLVWALDPMITFGVTVNSENEMMDWANPDVRTIIARGSMSDDDLAKFKKIWWDRFDGLCRDLSIRNLTGNAATDAINRHMEDALDADDVEWGCRILNKDLRAGFSISTLNKAKPDTLNPFTVALAEPYVPEKHEFKGAWCVEPKLDGLRMVVLDGKAYTRNGREIESVGHILTELDCFKDDFVFDGEIMGATEFNEDSGKIRKKGMGANLELVYNVFDCIPRDQWIQKQTVSYAERRKLLVMAWQSISPKHVKMVPSVPIGDNPTAEHLFQVRDEMIALGYEGAMAKFMDAPYVWDRSDNILKIKQFQSIDGRIKGAYEGKKKNVGKLGGFLVEFDGVITRVGGGYTDDQRKDWWEKAKAGGFNERMIEAEFQNKTPDGKLRNPVFIKFRPDKD